MSTDISNKKAYTFFLSNILNDHDLEILHKRLTEIDYSINNIEEEKKYKKFQEKFQNLCTCLVKCLEYKIEIGDIIQTKIDVNHNDTKLIWDGEKFIDLDYEVDDYGAVPPLPQFCFQNVPLNYWMEAINHNNLIPLNHLIYQTSLIKSLKILHNYDNQCEIGGYYDIDNKTDISSYTLYTYKIITYIPSLRSLGERYPFIYEINAKKSLTNEELIKALTEFLNSKAIVLYEINGFEDIKEEHLFYSFKVKEKDFVNNEKNDVNNSLI